MDRDAAFTLADELIIAIAPSDAESFGRCSRRSSRASSRPARALPGVAAAIPLQASLLDPGLFVVRAYPEASTPSAWHWESQAGWVGPPGRRAVLSLPLSGGASIGEDTTSVRSL